MKKPYEAPSADVVKFEAQDVITTSGNLNGPPGNPDGTNTLPPELTPDL